MILYSPGDTYDDSFPPLVYHHHLGLYGHGVMEGRNCMHAGYVLEAVRAVRIRNSGHDYAVLVWCLSAVAGVSQEEAQTHSDRLRCRTLVTPS